MEIDFINHWIKSDNFLAGFQLIEVGYQTVNLTSLVQKTITITLFGIGFSFYWESSLI